MMMMISIGFIIAGIVIILISRCLGELMNAIEDVQAAVKEIKDDLYRQDMTRGGAPTGSPPPVTPPRYR